MIDTTKNIADDLDALSSRWASDRFYMGSPVDDVREIVERLRTLSARASAGEGVPTGWLITWNDGSQKLSFDRCHEDDGSCVPVYTAAPQPAQAGAGGGVRIKTKGPDDFASHVCPAESSAVWNACVYEHNRIAEGLPPILSSTEVTPASPATGGKRHVGDSKFESWYADYCRTDWPDGTKQIARDAYAAGMGDATPQPAAAHPELPSAQGWLDSHCAVATTEWMRGWDAARSALAAAAPQPQEDEKARRPCPRCDTCNDLIVIGYCRDCASTVADAAEDTPPAHGDGEGDVGLQEVINSMEHDASDIRLGRQWMSACEHYLPKLRALATRPTPEAQEARDAARYRWVRACDRKGELAIHVDTMCEGELLGMEQLDAAIDAFLAASGGSHEPR